MILYLIRHAEAVDRNSGDVPDDYRVLSSDGREVVKKVGRWCADQQILIERIFSSPLLRAVQTAEILSAIINSPNKVEIILALGAGGSPEQILRFLPQYQHLDSLALVGHEPTIGITASTLIGMNKKISFSPGSICCLVFHGIDQTPQASFRWMIQAVYDAKTQTVTLKKISSVESL